MGEFCDAPDLDEPCPRDRGHCRPAFRPDARPRRPRQGGGQPPRHDGQGAAGVDRAADHRRGKAQRRTGRRLYAAPRARRRIPAGAGGAVGRRARRLRDAGRGRAGDARHLFHVRRQAVRPRRMVEPAARRPAGRPAGRGAGHHGPRRGQSEGAGNGLPRRASRLQGERAQAAGQSGAGGRGRGRDRLAQFPDGRRRPASRRRAQEDGRRVHPGRRSGPDRAGGHHARAPRARSSSS